MTSLLIQYLRLDPGLSQSDFLSLRRHIPQHMAEKNDRFVRFIDRQRNLFGILLLNQLWKQHFDQPMDLQRVRYSASNRPYLPDSGIDFNISHAGDFVICVLISESQVGIDIEKKKPVDFSEFTNTMNHIQWQQIRKSNDPVATFFKYWCIKESVIKADGRGLSLPLTEIIWEDQIVAVQDKMWHINPFYLDADHFGCLACDQRIPELSLQEVRWSELLD